MCFIHKQRAGERERERVLFKHKAPLFTKPETVLAQTQYLAFAQEPCRVIEHSNYNTKC